MQFLNNTSWIRGKPHVPVSAARSAATSSTRTATSSPAARSASKSTQGRRGRTNWRCRSPTSCSGRFAGPKRPSRSAARRFRATSFASLCRRFLEDHATGLRWRSACATRTRRHGRTRRESCSRPRSRSWIRRRTSADRAAIRSSSARAPERSLRRHSVRWPNIAVVQDGRLADRLVKRDNNDFAPRIGITWSPSTSG